MEQQLEALHPASSPELGAAAATGGVRRTFCRRRIEDPRWEGALRCDDRASRPGCSRSSAGRPEAHRRFGWLRALRSWRTTASDVADGANRPSSGSCTRRGRGVAARHPLSRAAAEGVLELVFYHDMTIESRPRSSVSRLGRRGCTNQRGKDRLARVVAGGFSMIDDECDFGHAFRSFVRKSAGLLRAFHVARPRRLAPRRLAAAAGV